MTDLLACPFCGDDGEKGQQTVTMMNEEHTQFDRITCRCCGAMAPELNWQKRATATASEATAAQQDGWISVEDRLPGPGVAVLAFFRNKLGKKRTVRAHHAPKHTIEAGHWDEDSETDDTEDGSFEPEGWYEDPAVGETMAFISPESDGVVTHWRPLPAAPANGEGTG